jgi:RimJ/RimL family protein N-acetyltransferase
MNALLTSRLVLNDLTLDDAFDLFAVRGDAEAMAYWDWPADPNPGVTRMLVSEMLQEASEGHARYWTLRLRSDFTFVGLCDLSELHPEKSADLGFMLMRRYWGQGLAQEAVTAVLAFAQQLGLRSVHARVHEDNERSVRLLERTGFVATQFVPHLEIRPGVFRDCRGFTRVL